MQASSIFLRPSCAVLHPCRCMVPRDRRVDEGAQPLPCTGPDPTFSIKCYSHTRQYKGRGHSAVPNSGPEGLSGAIPGIMGEGEDDAPTRVSWKGQKWPSLLNIWPRCWCGHDHSVTCCPAPAPVQGVPRRRTGQKTVHNPSFKREGSDGREMSEG